MKLGLWGGHGGRAWEWKGTIEKILVRHGVVVDSLTFGYVRGFRWRRWHFNRGSLHITLLDWAMVWSLQHYVDMCNVGAGIN